METESLQNRVEEALRTRSFTALRRMLQEREPADVAESFRDLPAEELAVAFRVLARDEAAEVFEYLDADVQESLLKALAREQVAAILNDMAPDERTNLLEEMPASATKKLLGMLSPEDRRIATKLLGYPEDSIGRLMTPYVISASKDWTVKQTLKHIRKLGPDMETLNVLYVVDDRGVLVDDLRIRQLILAHPRQQIHELCDGHVIALRAHDDQETAIQVFKQYDRVAFPVTDSKGVLLGIVTHDDVLDVAEEEATEDIHKLGGSEALEAPYLRIGFFEMARKRAVWLVALFLAQMLTLNTLGMFRDKIAETVALVLFVPTVISAGGNSGSQAATLVIRAMALGEVQLGDWFRVMRREILFGVLFGLVVAVLGFARVYVGQSWSGFFGPRWLDIGFAVGAGLIAVVVWGVLLGAMMPFVLRRVGVDPATSSNPFVATTVDVTGSLIYLLIATRLV